LRIPIGETAVVVRTDYEKDNKITKIRLILLVEITGYYESVGQTYGYKCRILDKVILDYRGTYSRNWHRDWIEVIPKLKKTRELLSQIPNLPNWVKLCGSPIILA